MHQSAEGNKSPRTLDNQATPKSKLRRQQQQQQRSTPGSGSRPGSARGGKGGYRTFNQRSYLSPASQAKKHPAAATSLPYYAKVKEMQQQKQQQKEKQQKQIREEKKEKSASTTSPRPAWGSPLATHSRSVSSTTGRVHVKSYNERRQQHRLLGGGGHND